LGTREYVGKRSDSGIYIYIRRVPKKVAELDDRGLIKKDLGTRDFVEASIMARQINEANEALWASMLAGGDPKVGWARHESAMRLAAAYGFNYKTTAEIVAGSDNDLLSRIEMAETVGQKAAADALLGIIERPKAMLADVWDLYAQHKAAEFEGLSPNQMRKHKGPRERAIAYAVAEIGNKPLDEITRDDVLRFRDWWMRKLVAEGLRADSLNRSFTDIKGMLSVVDSALHTSFHTPWEKTRVRPTNKTRASKRPPFPLDFVQQHILAPGALDGLNLEARMIVYGMVETGLSPSESANLRPQDIRIDAAIPHLDLPEREDRRLKTDYRPRQIPLVGVSLWAFKQCPNGFARYRDKEDSLSAAINAFLWENKLRPTKAHVLYSLRHTFQDRILAASAPDRLQADLMGHEFDRPVYGEGASLRQKLDLLERIKFKWQDGAPT
jgi:integrase